MTESVKFTITSRTIGSSWNAFKKLKTEFEKLKLGDINQVVSVFGAVKEYSPLYGGRLYRPKNSLSYKQVESFAKRGIGMSLTLSNHHFSEDKYKQTIPILEKLHKKGNSIIATNDELAKRIKNDFPLYCLKGSVMKQIHNLDQIHKTLEIYDYLALLPKLNDNVEFLQSIDCKDRVILFASVSCLYNCNADDCFIAVSDLMAEKVKESRPWCSHKNDPEMKKIKLFDLKEERFKGFSFFKVSSYNTETA